MPESWQIGDLARQDIYPDERYMQPPPAIPAATGEGYAGLGGDPSHLATTIKNWWTNQPSWLSRAQAENQKTTEAFQRGGMGEIAKQLATDTTEPQELYGAFGVGNIKGVKPPLAPGALAATSEYRPPFYSAVEQAVQGAKQNAAPGQQWAGFLRNQPGVKPEEVEALGLGKLFEQPGSVPKQAVLGEIAANRVNVGEVMKVDKRTSATGRTIFQDRDELAMRQYETPYDRLASEQKRWVDDELASVSPTKFSQYTLPGGENYREMLLTLPGKKVTPSLAEIENLAKTRYEGYHMKENDPPWERIAPDVQRLYREHAHEKIVAAENPSAFRSSHYDEPNILAHVRYNDRVIDGKKTLFVEEVQSDWHQKGKRQGYGTEEQRRQAITDQLNALTKEYEALPVHQRGEIVDRMNALHDQMTEVRRSGGVPDAPFKTTWPELAMKRIIREAADKGYDKVAWTPGSVQAERYDLSRHVTQLHLTHNRDGAGSLIMRLKDGRTESVPITSKENLAETVGKDIAEKLYEQGFKGNGKASLSGVDLKVGGEGMKGFYDEILPATVNRLVKKHGGRVQQGEVATRDVSSYDIRETGGGRWRIVERGSGNHVGGQTFANGSEAEKWLAANGKTNQSVHTLDITPQLRAQAMKGFPLFTAGGVAATGIMGEMARQDEYQ